MSIRYAIRLNPHNLYYCNAGCQPSDYWTCNPERATEWLGQEMAESWIQSRGLQGACTVVKLTTTTTVSDAKV